MVIKEQEMLLIFYFTLFFAAPPLFMKGGPPLGKGRGRLRSAQLVRVGVPEELFASNIIPDAFGVALRRVRDGSQWRYFCTAETETKIP